ncbi:MAG: SRPBCC family protein [Tumebacillaceae bacterium]
MKFTYTLAINAPIERVFTCITEDEKKKIWMQGVMKTEYPHGKDPAHPVGTQFKQQIKEGKRIVEYNGEITAYEAPSLFAVRVGNPMFSFDTTYRLEVHADGTTLNYESQFVSSSSFAKFMGKLFGWFTRKLVLKQMAALKQLAEQEQKTL